MSTILSTSNCYPSRLCGRTIRLLELLTDSDTDDIKCYLHTYELDNVPEFEALSYVWGDPKVTTTITCNGHPLDITINLSRALQRLIQLGSHLIWADAICINQLDLEERSHQVPLMGDIYEAASRVMIWLGPDDSQKSAGAIQLIQLIKSTCDRFAQRNGEDVFDLCYDLDESKSLSKVRMRDMVDAATANSIPESSWDSLLEIFNRPWFERIWCVQEVALSREASVLIGDLPPVDWISLGITASWLVAINIAGDDYCPNGRAILYSKFCKIMFIESISRTGYGLMSRLDEYRDFKATDPRDKFYGLAGLMSRRGDSYPFQIDYVNTSMADICTAIAVWMIQGYQDLRPLSGVNHEWQDNGDIEERLYGKWPSWIQYWDAEVPYETINADHNPYKACGSQDKFCLPLGAKVLDLDGLVFDDVLSTSDDMESWKLDPGYVGELDLMNDNPSRNVTASRTPAQRVACLARTLLATLYEMYIFYKGKTKRDCETFYDDLAAYLRGQGLPPEDSAPQRWRKIHDFKIIAEGSCFDRRLFWTKMGFIGLGPGCMRPGDQVVVVHGSKVPFVLRAKGDDWLFMGECYVDEIMYGEAFEGSVEGWERPPERTFRVV